MSTIGMNRRDTLAGGMSAALAVALAGCGGGGSSPTSTALPTPTPVPTPTPTPTPTPGTLTVNLGISAVSQTAGAMRDVFADADPTGQVFDKWTGEATLLLTPGERRSGATVPTGSHMVTATFKPLAEFVPQTAVLNGFAATNPSAVNAYWFFPKPKPRGVVFRFHGSGGNGATQFSKVEERKFARDCVGSGYAVVSLDSNDRVNKNWDGTTVVTNPAANVDIANVQKLIANLTALGLMDATTPLFASGHSAGAGNALRTAFLLGWKASHQSCVPGVAAIASATTAPGIWTMAQNDNVEDPMRNASALTNSNALAARGIATVYIVVVPSAVYPSRFTQIAGLGVSDSTAIYTAIKTAGKLDANDYQTVDPNTVDYTTIIPPIYSSFYKDIGDQLNVAYTAHQFSAATSRRVLDFFDARL